MEVKSIVGLIFFVAVTVTGCASVPKRQSTAMTLEELAKKDWGLASFTVGKDVMTSKVPLRVSTYSYPPFIHRGQIEQIGEFRADLEGLCKRQGGQWVYEGSEVQSKAFLKLPDGQNSNLTAATRAAPVTVDGMKKIVAVGEEEVAREVMAQLLAAAANTDPMVFEAVKFARTQTWLGQFTCQGKPKWGANIAYEKASTRRDGALLYKDVILSVAVKEMKE
ncbi:hypothetical protein [Crenobacter luteus]|uniref:hypothetical protein n=1 Tax=Crenobacter luteus TaxID=1452487 RepID=UPI001051221C|nr:hypothetical protein [Crenobacter luteus]